MLPGDVWKKKPHQDSTDHRGYVGAGWAILEVAKRREPGASQIARKCAEQEMCKQGK